MSPAPKPFLEETGEAGDPAEAPPIQDETLQGRAMKAAATLSRRRVSTVTRFAIWTIGSVLALVISVAAYDFVTGLLQRNLVLGWLALALVSLAVLSAAILGLREWAAFVRLRRLDRFRLRAEAARGASDLGMARKLTGDLARLYAPRGDVAWGLARLAEREAEVMDADALLMLAERELMANLDAQARDVVEAAARQVAAVTAFVPLALADVATALVANLRMIRKIAEIYGGRSGNLGSLRLLRTVFESLVAAGAIALTDDLIGSVAGGGVLSKLSRRFGEGVVNGALTARVGVATMEQCRPLPFSGLPRPGVSALVSRALTGLVSKG